MKKAQSTSVTTKTKQIANHLKKESEEILDHEAVSQFLNRLTSDKKYRLEDIRKVSKVILEDHNKNYVDQFVLVTDLSTLGKTFESKKKSITENKPIFFMFNEGTRHWYSFAFVKIEHEIYFLCKSSLGKAFPAGLVPLIDNNFNENVIEVYHSGQELKYENGQSEAPMALKNMEIMIEGLHFNKKKFIENFQMCNFCKEKDVQKVKENYRERLTERLFTSLVVEEKHDDEFNRELNKLIDEVLAYKNSSNLCNDYHQLLLTETSKFKEDPSKEINIEKINAARKKILDDESIQSLISKHSQSKADGSPTNDELEIEKKFPAKIWIVKKLITINNNALMERVLKQISERWKIDFDKLKQFVDIDKEKMKKEKSKVVEKPDNFDDFANIQQKPATENGNQEKSLDQIISEIRSGEDELEPSMKEKIKQNYARTMEIYHQWEEKDCQAVRSWAVEKRGSLGESDFLEAIAVMNRANNIVTGGHQLRIPQMISLLMLMQFKANKVMLCQIATGEGKTAIISILASLKVLQGNQVDIITSNQVLAGEGATTCKKFYDLLSIDAACNNADEKYKHGPRSCYEADIVYGSIGNFQFDYLRDSFERLETRGNRKLDIVIVDEVDSMLIDNGGHIAKLASPFPGIECLEYIYIKIWQALMKTETEIKNIIEEKLDKKALELKKDLKLSENDRQEMYDLFTTQLIRNQVGTMNESIKAKNLLELELIPKHLKSFAKESLGSWIDNAIYAKYSCHENEKYVLKTTKKGVKVVPVDYQCTGVTLTNTVWSNGLHQFVQLKHNLSLSPETLTSSFISNVGYIGLYGNNLYGLTGTLGSTHEQKFLAKAYNGECAFIPTYKQKKFIEIDGLLSKDEDWLNTVAISAFILAKKKRSVLLICETIKELKEIEEHINALKKLETFTALKVKTFSDEDNSHLLKEEVGIEEIIIATNIAGRGSDFRTTDELEDFGGLHVIVSFLSINKRVQDQAFGRTSRQGKSGTAQLIINPVDNFKKFATVRL